MEQHILPLWPLQLTDTLRLAVALLLAGVIGEGLARLARLPRITGYSLTGIVLGPAALAWFNPGDVAVFRIAIDLALALLLFELGVRVDLRWFRANPWIIASSLAEAVLTFVAIFLILHGMDASTGFAATVAAIAIGTSPAVVMRVSAELRAQGQVTQRLLVHTALNVLYAVVLSKLIVGGMHGAFRGDWLSAVLHPLYLLGGSLLMGALIAHAFSLLRRRFAFSDEQGIAILFGLLLASQSLLSSLALPTMLAPLLAGVLIRHRDRRPHGWPRHFGTAGGVLVILLFVFTGMTLTGEGIAAGGLAALALIAVRVLAKGAGIALFGAPSGLSLRQTLALALALTPMSAVAFLLVDDVMRLYPEFGMRVGAVVLSMVAVLELLGPVAVQWALRRCGESRAG